MLGNFGNAGGRWYGSTFSDQVVLFNGFRLDRRSGLLFRRDQRGVFVPLAIGSRALDILGVLIERPGDLVSRAAMMDAVWPGTAVEDSNLNVQVAALRRILDEDREQGSCIQTVSGHGYRFTESVKREEADAAFGAASNARDGSPATGNSVALLTEAVASTPTGTGLRSRVSRGVPIVLIALTLAGLAAAAGYRWFESASAPPRLSMVVLPFAHLGNDPDQEYFVDAISDDLTTDLSRISGSFVIARSTAFASTKTNLST